MAGRLTRQATRSISARKSRKRRAHPSRRATPLLHKREKVGRGAGKPRQWSQGVTMESNALDLEQGVFTLNSPEKIAASLKRSAEASQRRKADPYRSALSMLTFYINRAGKNLSAHRKKILNRAKIELKAQFRRA